MRTEPLEFDNILEFYVFAEHQLVQMLAKLDRLRLIELQANNRIKLLVAPNFGWLPNGPIQQVFLKTISRISSRRGSTRTITS